MVVGQFKAITTMDTRMRWTSFGYALAVISWLIDIRLLKRLRGG
jgi:hypothetical protein